MENEVKAPKKTVAYAMVQGANFMQYKIIAFRLEDDVVVSQEIVGVPDLKPIVMGRLLRLLVRV